MRVVACLLLAQCSFTVTEDVYFRCTGLIMPELNNPVGEGDLADLLQANGYSIGGASPHLDMLAELPKEVKSRVSALKALQVKSIDIESKFYEQVHLLEKKFEEEFNKIYEERRKIVQGEYEPAENESTLPLIHGSTEEEINELNEKSKPYNNEKGVPSFWLYALKAADNVGDMIQDADKPILEYLTDITTSVECEPNGFTLYFHFAENPYFENKILTKKYEIQISPDADDVFDYDGPSVTTSVGDTITWKDGKDVTKKVIKKKQKKGANAGKFLTKTVKADSFFNFFDPPAPLNEDEKNEEDDDDDTEELLRADFELGQIIRDHVVPRAVLFFTGEAADMDMFDEFEDEGDDEDDYDGGSDE